MEDLGERNRLLRLRAEKAIEVSKEIKERRLDYITKRVGTRMQYLRRQGLQP